MNIQSIIESLQDKLELLKTKEFNEANIDKMMEAQEIMNLLTIYSTELNNYMDTVQTFSVIIAGSENSKKADKARQKLENLAQKLDTDRAFLDKRVREIIID